jgi:hypothetical protein
MSTQIRLNKPLLIALSTTAALTTQLLIASPAKAECVFEGTTYQTGETVGSYVCMPDKTWQQR